MSTPLTSSERAAIVAEFHHLYESDPVRAAAYWREKHEKMRRPR